MAELKIRSFGAQHGTPAHLNVVMPQKVFANAKALADYSQELLRHPQFPGYAPHALLFSETPFPQDYFPKRLEVKKAVAEMQHFLAINHPNSVIAFSVNEGLKSRRALIQGKRIDHAAHSNTSYLVSAARYAAYSKLENATNDNDNMERRNPGLVASVARDAGGQTWHQRARRFKRKTIPFPQLTLSSRHQVQYRNCLDTIVRKTAAPITLVSAIGLPMNYIEELARRTELLFVNDGHFARKAFLHGNQVVYLHLDPSYMRQDAEPRLKALEKELAEKFVRVHIVD